MAKINDYEKYAARRQAELQKGENRAHCYVEKPAMESILPSLVNKKILLLGCGTGEETQLLERFGATQILGVDISSQSIELARKAYPQYEFHVGDMHELNFPDNEFDFTYSSLAIHYSPEPLKIYKEAHRVLKPGGTLQFSVGHPMRWASVKIEMEGVSTRLLGFSEEREHPRLYGSYTNFDEYIEPFPNGEVLSLWIGPPSLHFNLLKEAGFGVDNFIETMAIPESQKKVSFNWNKKFRNFPQFTVFSAVAKK